MVKKIRSTRLLETLSRALMLIAVLFCVMWSSSGCQSVRVGRNASPEQTELAYRQGAAALEAGHYSEAIPFLDKVVGARPADTMTRYNLGVAYQRVHSYRESVRTLTAWGDRGLELRSINRRIRVPEDADADYIYALGNSFQELRELDNALECFEDAIQVDASNLKPRYSRAMLLQQSGQLQEALLAWKDYLEYDSKSAWAEGARKNLRKLQKEIDS